MSGLLVEAMEQGWLPDLAIRAGIRRLCKQRLREIGVKESLIESESRHAELLRKSPLAVHAREANEQHYELPSSFFELVLGRNLKYSSAFFPGDYTSLDSAEDAALSATIERAGLADGMKVLELGCGWGSLTLAMGRRFPRAEITALSNSHSQRSYIEDRAKREGLRNIRVITQDISTVDGAAEGFVGLDRVVSVEMFEHLRNYELLFKRISGWLKPEGKLFVHVFSHRLRSYLFETEGDDNWMGRYFFTGGQMPAHGLFGHFERDLKIERAWRWDGNHYARTAEAWLENLDRNRERIRQVFVETYGTGEADRWVQRWRVFFMSCAELFAYDGGQEWGVSHYLLSKGSR